MPFDKASALKELEHAEVCCTRPHLCPPCGKVDMSRQSTGSLLPMSMDASRELTPTQRTYSQWTRLDASRATSPSCRAFNGRSYSTTDLRRKGLSLREVWCSGVGRACRLLAQRASPPFGARGQSTKNLLPHSQAVEVFHLAMQQGLRAATSAWVALNHCN